MLLQTCVMSWRMLHDIPAEHDVAYFILTLRICKGSKRRHVLMGESDDSHIVIKQLSEEMMWCGQWDHLFLVFSMALFWVLIFVPVHSWSSVKDVHQSKWMISYIFLIKMLIRTSKTHVTQDQPTTALYCILSPTRASFTFLWPLFQQYGQRTRSSHHSHTGNVSQ